jgi:branched-subunit amino acid transport protein
MIKSEYIILLFAMGLVTYLPRWAPLFFLSDRKLPDWLVEWLDMIPVAILSALLIPELVITGEPRHLDLLTPELLVAIPTFMFAYFTKSLGGTVIVGMALYWLTSQF